VRLVSNGGAGTRVASAIIRDLDTALKHRITGAVILVGLAVLLLPELFSGAGQPPSAAVGLEEEGIPIRQMEVDLTDGAAATDLIADEPIPELAPSTAQAESTLDATAGDGAPNASDPSSATSASSASTAAAAAVAPRAQGASRETGFFVQAGVFSNRQGAERVAADLRAKGFAVRITAAESAQPLHRVWVGPAKDRAAADALLRRVRAAGFQAMVVSS
jgi:cell division septation protein DedD